MPPQNLIETSQRLATTLNEQNEFQKRYLDVDNTCNIDGDHEMGDVELDCEETELLEDKAR